MLYCSSTFSHSSSPACKVSTSCQRRARCDRDVSHDGARSPTSLHRPQPKPESQEAPEERLGKARHRQNHVSKDSRADGTPAALAALCFTHWGGTALSSAVLRAAGPSSDHSHLPSLFFSRRLPAGRLFLTALPMLEPSHCLKLLLLEEQP